MNLTELNSQFSIQDKTTRLQIKQGEGNIPLVEIQNKVATATISLQGAHLLSWIPAGETDVIWLSEQATFAEGKSVRGGIPICWPWFGAHDAESQFPAHGFARTTPWQIVDTTAVSDTETQILFKLQTEQLDNSIQRMWPWATTVEYRVTIGRTLTLELVTRNNSRDAIILGQALHTYFAVNDLSKTVVTGLEDKAYLDKPDGFKRKLQSGPVSFTSEVDRIYLQTPDTVTINDQTRKIIISKHGSDSTVVWNPWREVAAKMGDLGEQGYLNMLCVESANAAEDTVKIEPGGSHCLKVHYQVDPV